MEGEGIRASGAFPNERGVDEHLHLCSIHFRAKSMRLSGTQSGNRSAAARLDIPVSAVAALCAGVLPGDALDGNHQLPLRLDAPHRVKQVARLLPAPLNATLAT